jgi:hypothetical protein
MANTHLVTCSITKEQSNAVEELKLSPSALLQGAIEEKIENYKISKEQIKEYERKIEVLRSTLDKQRDFIEARGLMNDFLGII